MEDAEERLVVNTSLLITPEVLNEALYFLLIDSQFHVWEDIFEVISWEGASAFLVKEFESIGQTLDSSTSERLYKKVEDLFLWRPTLNTMSGELSHKFLVADEAVSIIVARVNKQIYLLLTKISDLK